MAQNHQQRNGVPGGAREKEIYMSTRGPRLCRLRMALLVLGALGTAWLHSQPVVTLEVGTSPNPVGSGARALGQGNAFIAVADDATAASWNPGGLSQLERPEFSFAVEGLCRRETLSSGVHPEADSSESLRLAAFNYGSVVFPFFAGRNMVLSLNYLQLYHFDKDLRFPFAFVSGGAGEPDLSMDYSFDQAGTFSVVAPAFGIDVTDHLSLGITLNIWNDSLTHSSMYERTEVAKGSFVWEDMSSSFHTREVNRFEVAEGYSVVLGALYRFNRRWALGAVLKPAFTLDIDHEHVWVSGDQITGAGTETRYEKTTDGELDFPWIVGAGVAWRPRDPFTVSTDVTWTQWSRYTYHDGKRDVNPLTGDAVSRDELDDTFTWRTGAEYLLIRRNIVVPLRCGFGYDPGPAVDSVDDFYTINLGAGIQLDRFMFDVGYEFRWGNDVNQATLRGVGATQDVRRHRVLASLIVYF